MKAVKKHVIPDSKKLPPLLDKHKEKKRLISISKEQDLLTLQRKKQDNLNKILRETKKNEI